MANIKLKDNNWEASGVYDIDQQKNQRQINAEQADLKSALDETEEQLYYGRKYKLLASNFEYGGISFSENGLTYVSSNKLVRTKNNYSVDLHEGDVVSIGDAKAVLTLLRDGQTVTVDMSIKIYWLNPETSKYEQREWAKTDFIAPATTSYYFILHIDGEPNYLVTTYSDAIEGLSSKIVITTYDYGTLRGKFDALETDYNEFKTDYNELKTDYNSSTEKLARRSIHNQFCKFVAHQGYDPNNVVNHNVLSGFQRAAEHGFDWAETDVRTTSDGYLVCCHDPSFEDATTGDTVTIETSTLAELQTHDYYGSTIATLEEVVKTCKINGIGLILDQLGTTDEVNGAFAICKKYEMLDNVGWIVWSNSSITNTVLSNYSKSKIFVITGSNETDMDSHIAYANSLAIDGREVYLYFPYSLATAENMESKYATLNANVFFAIWTVNYMPYLTPRMQYVSFVTSDKIAYYDYYLTLT